MIVPILKSFVWRRTVTVAASLSVLTSYGLTAQQRTYADYPQKRGLVEQLSWQSMPLWLTINGELRGRTEGQTSYSYEQNGDRVYELTRGYIGLEVRPTKYLTGYVQAIDSHALGLPLHATAANMRDVFDDRQAYVRLQFAHHNVPVQLVAGRQEMKFGSERIVGISDWTNNSRTWDGFTARIGRDNRLDLFSTSVVTVHTSSLDKHGAGLTFHGAYGSLAAVLPKTRLDPYLLVRTVRGVTSQQGHKGDEVQVTLGAEMQGQLPSHFDYLVNGSLQRGTYANDSIHAGQGFAKLSYSLPKVGWQPRLGFEYDYATGTNRRNLYRVSTYDQQYPSNHNAFGLTDLFGYQNLRQGRVNLDLGPSKNLTLLLQGECLRLASRHDNLYTSSGASALRAPSGGFSTDSIGDELDLSGKYVFNEHLVMNIGVGHLFPGALLILNSHGAAETLGYYSLTYRFRVDKRIEERH
jgi:hypothetical protein